MKIILVISHPRSGTHFLIDSLVRNLAGAGFPRIRPSRATVENLVLTHDNEVTEMFYSYLFDDCGDNIKIFKTHMLPEEFEMALKKDHYIGNCKDRRILEYLFSEAMKIYITRNVKDVMVSWFLFHKIGGGIHEAMDVRTQKATLSEFLRFPNYFLLPCRGFSEYDENMVSYWTHHNNAWKEKCDISVNYEDLKNNFENTIKRIAGSLGLETFLARQLRRPPNIRLSGNKLVDMAISFIHFRVLGNSSGLLRKRKTGGQASSFLPDDYEFIKKYTEGLKN